MKNKLPKEVLEKIPAIFFDNGKGSYWVRVGEERFVPRTSAQIIEEMQLDGIHTEIKSDFGLSLGNEILANARRNTFVEFAGPIAGHPAGIAELSGGVRVLVTRTSRPVEAAKSDECPRFEKFLAALLCDEEDKKNPINQVPYALAWMKCAYETLQRGDMRPGQLLALCGPGTCGKSFLQILITELLGGRYADPYDYMTGKTNFNEDLSEAEHLPMGDKAADYQISVRKKFAAKIKEFCVESSMRVHGKGKKGIALHSFRRLSISVNHEPEHMLIIPPLDDDMRPKVMLLKCCDATAELSEDRKINMRDFTEELPRFARFLLNWKIPTKMKDRRFGVCAFHHPRLLEIISDLTPEQQLLGIIDDGLWKQIEPKHEWSGSAEELKTLLLKTDFRDTVGRLLEWPSACGTYLARLVSKLPVRFKSTRSKGRTRWQIIEHDNA